MSIEQVNGNSSPKLNNNAQFRLRVIIVRHGESQNNVYHEISQQSFEENRVPDPGITERGRQQALAVATYLKERSNATLATNIDEIHVSPMRRAMETAAPIVEALPNVPIKIWTDIYEISGMHDKGVGHPGMPRSEIQAEFPAYQLPASVTESGWYPVDLGREALQHGQERCGRVWDRLRQMANQLTKDSTIVMVVHGAFVDSLLQVAFGLLPVLDGQNDIQGKMLIQEEKHWFFPMWNTAITAMDIYHRDMTTRPTLLFHNSTSHLSPELIKTDKLGKC